MTETDRLRSLIVAVRRRWFMTVALRTAGIAMAVAALPILAALIVYSLFALDDGPLLLLASAATLLSITAAALAIRRVEPRPDDTRVARFIEERAEARPGVRPLDDAVVSAVQASRTAEGDPRASFASLVVGAALRKLDGIDAAAIVEPSAIKRAAAAGVGGAALLALTFVIGMPALRHAMETARLRLFPGSITVEVWPGDTRVLAGQPVRINARLHSSEGRLEHAVPKLVVTDGT
ncbi:MAG TPA: hypothetical protein VGD94_14325, partial [Vicinamibacterales bacterium]